MSFDKISFNHFYIEIKNIMDPRFFTYINPEIQSFWKAESCYFALTINNGEVYVNMLVGKEKDNIEGMRALIKEVKVNGIKTLRFGTFSKNTRMFALYRYIGATKTRTIEKYYADGDDYVEYVLEIDKAKRFESHNI